MSTKECCGTCKWFGRNPALSRQQVGTCGCPLPAMLPHCLNGDRMIMDIDDGNGCPCYAEAEQ